MFRSASRESVHPMGSAKMEENLKRATFIKGMDIRSKDVTAVAPSMK